ncbi:MAG: acyl-CoA thioesterase [Treponema sp.]|nr:acyl-CoA thioesterase [Treponema sp.]
METFVMVRSEHLNHYGKLFGGQLLKWVDEFAWLAAKRNYKQNTFVTRAMDNIEFHHMVPPGAILRFHMEEVKRGTTSVVYSVDVYHEENEDKHIFSNNVTLVAVDEEGKKTPLVYKDFGKNNCL